MNLIDALNVKLKGHQKFLVTDHRKPDHNTFSVWSEEQLERMYENDSIDDTHFSVVVAVSATMGYSSTQIPVIIGDRDLGFASKIKGKETDEDE